MLIEISFPDIANFLIISCYYRCLSLIFGMPRKKSKKNLTPEIVDLGEEKKTTPRTAKIVLFVFGLGPLIFMCLFLFSNGFFSSP